MNRAVALICGICHPVFSVPNPHAEFVPTFTDKKLSPHGSAWPFAGRLSSCVKVFAFAYIVAKGNLIYECTDCRKQKTPRLHFCNRGVGSDIKPYSNVVPVIHTALG